MSKIIKVTNVMLSNSNKISTVINHGGVWFFLYDEKYAWCMKSWDYEGENRYLLYYLTGKGNDYVIDGREFEILSRQDISSLVINGTAIEYNTNELGSDEALQAFRQLYITVREKGIGIDKVFDEIIDGDNSQYIT
jgi:hypothetical protein